MYARNERRKQLTKLCSLGLVIGVSILGAAATQAMPIAPQTQAGLTIPVAGGCGPGWHRGFDGICRPNVAPGVVVAPGVGWGPALAAAAAFAIPTVAGKFAIELRHADRGVGPASAGPFFVG
jgi:hypothetical protein